jgi:hypothetical protein
VLDATLRLTPGDLNASQPIDYRLYELNCPVEDLLAGGGGVCDTETIWQDLADGSTYGLTVIESSPVCEVEFSAAAFNILQAAAGGKFLVGGQITSPIQPQGQGAFGGTDAASTRELSLVDKWGNNYSAPVLDSGTYDETIVPSPATANEEYRVSAAESAASGAGCPLLPPIPTWDRNFFLFDLSALPVGVELSSATLVVSCGSLFGRDPFTYTLFDVICPISDVLDGGGNDCNTETIWADLGSGYELGEAQLDAALRIDLNTAFLADANLRLGGEMAVGGSLVSNVYPSNAFSGTGAGSVRELVLTTGAPEIDVSPLTYDFGDVEIGNVATSIVTVSNIGTARLVMHDYSISGSSEFAVNGPSLPALLGPTESADLEVTFTPISEGESTGELTILSDDLDEATVVVSLGGTGVVVEPPPSEQISEILVFIDTSITTGELQGTGSGNSATGRVGALINMIEAAGDLIEEGNLDAACGQLRAAYRKVDGDPRPPDFVEGAEAPALANQILALMQILGCAL